MSKHGGGMCCVAAARTISWPRAVRRTVENARVLQTRLPDDATALFHPADLMGEASTLPACLRAEILGTQHSLDGFGPRGQQGAVRYREAGILLELLVQGALKSLADTSSK